MSEEVVGNGVLWFGVVAGPLAWSVQELAGTAITGGACHPNPALGNVFTEPGAWTFAFALTLAAAVAAAVSDWVAWRSWHTMRAVKGGGGVADAKTGRARYMALGGVLLSTLFLIGILFNVVGFIFVPLCTSTP